MYSAPTDRTLGVIADQTITLDGVRTKRYYPAHLRRIRYKDPVSGRQLVFLTNRTGLDALTVCELYRSRWTVELFFKFVKRQPTHQALLGHLRERRQVPAVDCGLGLCARRDSPQAPVDRRPVAHDATDSVDLAVRASPAL